MEMGLWVRVSGTLWRPRSIGKDKVWLTLMRSPSI